MRHIFSKSRIVTFSMIGIFASVLFSCKTGEMKIKNVKLNNEKDSISYALGQNVASSIIEGGLTEVVDQDMFMTGIKNTLLDKEFLTEEEVQNAMISLQNQLMENSINKSDIDIELSEELSEESKKMGKEFLKENAKKEGVRTTASGLQYEIVKEGKGNNPTDESIVKVHYTGRMINGDVFDSSEGMEEPIEFPLGNVIPGWIEGLKLMKPGAKYILYIPSDLAYGERGAPGAIGPNETLIFDVELVSFK